jgi:type I restriction enzyme S subunit
MNKWRKVTWSEVLSIKNGKNQKNVVNPDGIYPIYGSGGIMGYANDFLCIEGTTIIGRKGSINKPIYVEEKFWNVDTAFGLCAGDKLDKKFLYYFCTTYNFLKHNKATTLPSLTKADLLKIQIPLPPLSTQKKIATILDTADTYRQKTKALIEKYDALAQSLFLDMFGDSRFNDKKWQIHNLDSICYHIIDCPHSTPKYEDFITDYPCIRTTELRNGKIDWTSMKYLNREEYLKRTKRLAPQEGDIIYGREGSFGEAAIVPSALKFSLGQRVMLFRPNVEFVTSIFLHAVIRSPGVYYQALRVNTGSTVGHVNVKDIKNFKIIVPPFILQNQFADRIQLIEQQKHQAQASLQKAENLFNSLLQKAFSGELVG